MVRTYIKKRKRKKRKKENANSRCTSIQKKLNLTLYYDSSSIIKH